MEVKNLSFSYGGGDVLKEVSFTACPGQFLSILGPNGVGKSTLFKCVLGLLRNYRGEVAIDGADAKTLSVPEMAKRVAYIPQSGYPVFNYSVHDIVLMGVTSRLSVFETPKKQDSERADAAMQKIGIAHLRDRCFHHLSGGERQLVMIARALTQQAKVLMLDEPTSSLDFGNQVMVMAQARELAHEGYTVIATTHNPEQSYMFSDRILALKGGRILTDGPPREVLDEALIKELYRVEATVSSLFEDRVRVCTPNMILDNRRPEDVNQ
ncbi:MAG TPA: ABC transporter ATP-binding protein [Candidatus Acidoferrum sp.]|nr:ABC transporter ATP-binding protein [Candidatus Acidoferrum sp.]